MCSGNPTLEQLPMFKKAREAKREADIKATSASESPEELALRKKRGRQATILAGREALDNSIARSKTKLFT